MANLSNKLSAEEVRKADRFSTVNEIPVLHNSYTTKSVYNFTQTAAALIDKDPAKAQEILHENRGLLQKATISFIKPEQLQSFELGYRGVDKLLLKQT